MIFELESANCVNRYKEKERAKVRFAFCHLLLETPDGPKTQIKKAPTAEALPSRLPRKNGFDGC